MPVLNSYLKGGKFGKNARGREYRDVELHKSSITSMIVRYQFQKYHAGSFAKKQWNRS